MSVTKIKLGATLSYNTEKEKDIIEVVDALRSQHKLGDFISNILRVAIEQPELIEKSGVSLSGYGVTPDREKFFNDVKKQLLEMMRKINEIYDMSIKMYSLTQFNKQIGLEQKSLNLVSAQFILQKQVNEICHSLGISSLGETYASNKMYDVARQTDEVLEYLITTYDGIVGEIRQNSSIIKEQYNTTPKYNSNKNENIVDAEVLDSYKKQIELMNQQMQVMQQLIQTQQEQIRLSMQSMQNVNYVVQQPMPVQQAQIVTDNIQRREEPAQQPVDVYTVQPSEEIEFGSGGGLDMLARMCGDM